MQQTKIQLLPAEMELVSKPDIILTKNAILQKVRMFFGELQGKQLDILARHSSRLPEDVLKISPKISRGENYKGLPWLVLDNPRFFQRNNIFAIRTMFWWGNFFSLTLQLSGHNKTRHIEKITSNIAELNENEFSIYVGVDEWAHDLDPDTYKKLSSLRSEELHPIATAGKFLKLAIKFPIDPFEVIEEKLLRNYELLVRSCC